MVDPLINSMDTKNCTVCSREYQRNGGSVERWKNSKFCSRKCTATINKKFLNPHRPITEKTREKMRSAAKNRERRYGENANNWRGGRPICPLCGKHPAGRYSKTCGSCRSKHAVTPLIERLRKTAEYILWRKSVFERDNFTCVFCLQRGGILNADHIKPFAHYPELRFAIDNGRTLCQTCHRKTDTFGWKSANKNH